MELLQQRVSSLVKVRKNQQALIESLKARLSHVSEVARYRKNILVEIATDPTDADELAMMALRRFPDE